MSNNFLMKLAGVSPVSANYSLASFESHFQEVTENIDDITADAETITQNSDEIVATQVLETSMESLVASLREFDRIDDKVANLYRLSVESLLINSGIDLPVEVAVPSFESATAEEFTEKTEKKTAGILASIGKWVSEAITKLFEMIRNFFSKIITSTNSLNKTALKLQTKIKAIKGDKAKNDKPIKIGGSSRYLVNENGEPVSIGNFVMDVGTLYASFCHDWSALWNPVLILKNMPSPTSSYAEYSGWMSKNFDKLTKIKTIHPTDKKYRITPGWDVDFKAGELAKTNGGKPSVTLVQLAKTEAREFPLLSLGELESGVDKLLKAIKAVEGAANVIQDVTKQVNNSKRNSKPMAGLTDSIIEKYGAGDEKVIEITKDLRSMSKALVKMAPVITKGFAISTPVVLQTLKASISYMNTCADRYSDAEKSEIKEDARVVEGTIVD